MGFFFLHPLREAGVLSEWLFEDLFETQLWTRKHDAMTKLDITLFPMFINLFFRGLKLIRGVERVMVACSFLSQPRPVLG
jgi:hypothetical protein